jgi:hypothetical protein
MQMNLRARSAAVNLAAGALMLALALPVAAPAQTTTISVEAGPIWNQPDAQRKCPEVAKANAGVWTGQWRTTVPGSMSVCDVRLWSPGPKYVVEPIEAGPIWNQSDAERKCPEVGKTNGGTWTGQWRTTVPARMSVCDIRFRAGKG